MYNGRISKDKTVVSSAYTQIYDLTQQLNVRLLTVRDQFSDFRLQWLSSIFHSVEVYDFVVQETYALSLAERDYDVLVVGANDATRIAKFARANARMLTSRVMFALMDQTDPPRRARVLCAGFDDVFDLSRTVPEEAAVRIAAVWRRHQLVQEAEKARSEKHAAVRALTNGSELGRREVLLLEALVKKVNRPVSYHSLINVSSQGSELITFEHLKVLISNLRKKLHPSFRITAINGQGYCLVKAQF